MRIGIASRRWLIHIVWKSHVSASCLAPEIVMPFTRVFQARHEERLREEAVLRSSAVGTGDRSERIRTYHFPQVSSVLFPPSLSLKNPIILIHVYMHCSTSASPQYHRLLSYAQTGLHLFFVSDALVCDNCSGRAF